MKLYYSTSTGAMSCVIAIEEARIACEMIEVSWNRNVNVEELKKVNPQNKVPVLLLDNGKVLTQNAAILEYFADLKPNSKLLPKYGSWERSETMSWLSFMAADLQKAFFPIFGAKLISNDLSIQEKIKKVGIERLREYLGVVEASLQKNTCIAGPEFTVVDCYFIPLARLAVAVEAMSGFKTINLYLEKQNLRPGVQRALAKE